MLDRPSPSRPPVNAADAAPLVLLPGTLCDARLFAPVLGRLGVEARIPELSGADSAAGLAQLLLANAPARLSLCGFSLGAIIALEMIAQAPERIERLALIGCNPGVLDARAAADRAALRQHQFAGLDDTPLVHLMAAAASPESYRQQTAITLGRADSRPRLSRIAVPTLVLCGARDRVCPPAMSVDIARQVRGSRLVVVPGAGHYLPLERPETVADELAGWLATPAPSTAPRGTSA